MGLKFHTLIFLVSLLTFSSCYQEINTKKEYMTFLQIYSSYPSFQVFYNRHFKKSRQFEDFVEVIEDVEAKVKQYAKIIFTDCDEAFGEEFAQCQDIKDNNQNRLTLGLRPNSKFLSLSGKLLQRNPGEVKYNHPLDVYSVPELVQFIEGLVPSYLVDVVSRQEYNEFLKPRYSTKVIYFTKQDQIPLNIKKLSTIFHKRVDFARVQDLSQQLISKHNIIHFPTLLVLKYNYDNKKFDDFKYSGPHFDVQGYLKMKQFLQLHAATEPRNDLLFHSIKMETNNQIRTVADETQKDKVLDRLSGLVWIEQSSELTYLPQLQTLYNDFFNYIHIQNSNKSDVTVTLFNTEYQRVQESLTNQFPHLDFNGLDHKALLSNITFYMQKNYSVLVVPRKYGYFCPIINKQFFQGISNCFIGNDEALEQLKQQTGQFQYGVVAYQTANMEKSKFSGHVIKDPSYETVYKTLEEAVKIKLDSQIRNYLQSPVLSISENPTIFSLCADPRRKCIIAFLDPSKSIAFKTEQGYLKDIAQQYYSDYRIFWASLSCNQELLSSLEEPKANLIVIDSLRSKFYSLKQRITKSILIKFLKNIKLDTKRDKREKNIDLALRFNPCLEDDIEGEL